MYVVCVWMSVCGYVHLRVSLVCVCVCVCSQKCECVVCIVVMFRVASLGNEKKQPAVAWCVLV